MRACFHIELETPKMVLLNGLWFGPARAKRVIVWVHGLGSSAFTKLPIVDELVDGNTAVMTFNNRGHDKVASVTRGTKRILAGAAHEVFTDSVDDIEGAIRFAKAAGAKEIFLAGHSTGCQKSVYWASKKGKDVKGIILLAPISDYAAEIKISGKTKLDRYAKIAKHLVHSGKERQLMPVAAEDWYLFCDAQRFLSAYTGEGPEEIFTYWAQERVPKTLRTVRLPILVLLAEKDEYRDRPAKEMAAWFDREIRSPHSVEIVPEVEHAFKGGEKRVSKAIKDFMKQAV